MRNLLTAPSSIFSLVLFFLSFVASVYAREIRQALALPPSKALSFWKSVRLRLLGIRLGQLQHLHNDAYRVLVTLMFYAGIVGIGAMISILLLAMATIPINEPQSKIIREFLVFGAGIGAGGAFGGLREILWLGNKLISYEQSVQRLESKIAKLTRQTLNEVNAQPS